MRGLLLCWLVIGSSTCEAARLGTILEACVCEATCRPVADDCFFFDRCPTGSNCKRLYSSLEEDVASLQEEQEEIELPVCLYPRNEAYESQTAQAKLDYLWNKVLDSSNETGFFSSPGEFLFDSSVSSFETFSDEMPPGRSKQHNGIGYVAKLSFRASGTHPFTGVFATGSDHVLVRFSTVTSIPNRVGRIQPALAFKFLLDGQASANIVTLTNMLGHDDYNFVSLNFTKNVPASYHPDLLPVAIKFQQASNCQLATGVSDLSRYNVSTDDDDKNATIVTPYNLVFLNPGFLSFPSDPYNVTALAEMKKLIPVGTTVAQLYGSRQPGDDVNIFIGDFVLESSFYGSKFGDEQLFFRHQYMEEDLKLHPHWIDMINATKECSPVSQQPLTMVPPAYKSVLPDPRTCPMNALIQELFGGNRTAAVNAVWSAHTVNELYEVAHGGGGGGDTTTDETPRKSAPPTLPPDMDTSSSLPSSSSCTCPSCWHEGSVCFLVPILAAILVFCCNL